MADIGLTPQRLRKAAEKVKRLGYEANAHEIALHIAQWEQEQDESLKLKNALQAARSECNRVTGELVADTRRLGEKLAAAQARTRLLEQLLRQGRSILSNPSLVKVRGNLPGQVVFGDWAAKVDEAVPESAPVPKEEGEG